MSVFDINDYDILVKNGWKHRELSTYKSMKKDNLVDFIRCLEHNWAGSLKANELLSARLKKFCDYFEAIGQPEMFRKICMIDEERGQDDEWLKCNTLDGRWFYMNMNTGEQLPYGAQPIKVQSVNYKPEKIVNKIEKIKEDY